MRIKKLILFVILFKCYQVFAQPNTSNNQVGFSTQFIWNNTEIFNIYSGARAKEISGTALSHGFNINYTKYIFKGIFVTGGVGYHAQNFGIHRPFDFNRDTITNLLYHTKKYTYNNFYWLAAIGYTHRLSHRYGLTGSISYNDYHSFRQKYIPNILSGYQYENSQVETRSYSFGSQVHLNIGGCRYINERLTVDMSFLIPVHTKWRKDKIFRENENEFYQSKFSLGTNISIKYNLQEYSGR